MRISRLSLATVRTFTTLVFHIPVSPSIDTATAKTLPSGYRVELDEERILKTRIRTERPKTKERQITNRPILRQVGVGKLPASLKVTCRVSE